MCLCRMIICPVQHSGSSKQNMDRLFGGQQNNSDHSDMLQNIVATWMHTDLLVGHIKWLTHTNSLSGGEKLQEYLTLLAAKAKNSALLNVGFPEGGTEPNGESTPMVAFLNEFGRTVRVKNSHTEMSQGRSVEIEGDYYKAPGH